MSAELLLVGGWASVFWPSITEESTNCGRGCFTHTVCLVVPVVAGRSRTGRQSCPVRTCLSVFLDSRAANFSTVRENSVVGDMGLISPVDKAEAVAGRRLMLLRTPLPGWCLWGKLLAYRCELRRGDALLLRCEEPWIVGNFDKLLGSWLSFESMCTLAFDVSIAAAK